MRKPITTSPTANDEWAKRPNKASPGKLVRFWRCINVKAIKEEIITELVTLIEKIEGTNNAESFRSMLEMFKNYQIKKEALDQELRN